MEKSATGTNQRKSGLCWRLLAAALLSLSTASRAGDLEALKGRYIQKIIKFVDWPSDSLNSDREHFFVCVQGEERLKSIINAIQGMPAKERTIVVVNLAQQAASVCQVIFISASETWRLHTIFAELDDRPILSIGDGPNFAQEGGMIGLIIDGDRLGFEINQGTANRARLSIAAPLLSLAREVYQ